MGKKKQAFNAFSFFFMELKANHKSPISAERAVELASPLWNKMTPEQRRPYEEKAKLAKNNRPKETCAGESVLQVLKEEKQRIQKEEKAKREIENMVKVANSDKTVGETYFHLIHMNYFFHHELQDKYYPAEVALGKFNLRNGILKEDVYHDNVYPGKFPLGYKLTAQNKSDETHKLSTDFGNKDNVKEVLEMINYFNKERAPYFVLQSDLFVVEKMIQDLSAEYDVECDFNIYPLDYLFYVLKNAVYGRENNVWPTPTLGTLNLEKDPYEMCEEIACDYHQVIERQGFCSKSRVIRWAYMVCDNCSHMLNIDLIPGQHVPSNADVSYKLSSKVSKVKISKNSAKSTSSVSWRNTSTVSESESRAAYDSDVTSYHGFESTDSHTVDDDDDEPWDAPKRSARLRANHASQDDFLSGPGGSQSQQSQSQTQSQNQSLNMSQMSVKSYLPGRRPGDTSEAGFRGRGRGKLHRRPE